jgi:hypothetical protein
MYKMVEVFKTSVVSSKQASQLVNKMGNIFPDAKINFELNDCDNIPRFKDGEVRISKITKIVTEAGFYCAVLE